ncbi:MAG: glycosyltransferase family 1 protein [Patescibacteria group bacterium]
MVIGIDANEANVAKKVGISEYAYQLLLQFYRLQPAGITFHIYLKELPREELPTERKGWKYRVLTPKKLWTQWRLPLDLYTHFPRPDVFFSMTHYAPRLSPVPTVVAIMDVAYHHFPEAFAKKDLYQLQNWTKYSVEKARRVFAISQSTKNDIIKTYAIPEEKVIVTHLGIKRTVSLTPHVYGMNELKAKYGISDNFVLFVGTLQPRKNIARLIEAFAKVPKKDDLQLVIVGKKGWLYEDILAAPQKYGVEKEVKFLHFVPDDELNILYAHARCYVLPSLYEGFGLPVLEAMSHNCPVITSNVSSMPEAGGDAALYVDPKDVDDIAKKIEKLVTDNALRKTLIEKGREQIKKFSWEKTARQTLFVLEEVAGQK